MIQQMLPAGRADHPGIGIGSVGQEGGRSVRGGAVGWLVVGWYQGGYG